MTSSALLAQLQDPTLIDLVDALVEAIDLDRTDAVNRLREALEPFAATGLLNDELRLNGIRSSDHDHRCLCEVWL